MANLIAITGPSGTGKSTSIENLNSDETYIINTLAKPLPFKGSSASYTVDKKNIGSTTDWGDIVRILRGVSTNRPEIKTIVLDDVGFVMSTEFFKRANETGFTKFSDIGSHMFQIMNTAKSLRDDLNVVFMFHEDLALVEGFTPIKKIKTIGKLLDDKFTPEAIFTIMLWTKVSFDKEGAASYKFITNRTPNYPAKSPKGMFDSLEIDNDLEKVLAKIKEYYHG